MKTVQTSVMILVLIFALSFSRVSASTNPIFGGKTGDWVQYDLQNSFVSNGEMLRMDFLNVTGTNLTVNVTIYTAAFTEMNETRSINLTSQDAQDDFPLEPWLTARAYLISAGSNVNDSVYLGQEFGFRNITGDTTMSYAGANREVVYANFSKQEYNYTLFWDKQTGVLTEGIWTLGGAAVTDVLISETSMWGWIAIWWIWIAVAIAIALGIITSRKSIMKRLRGKPEAPTTKTKSTSSTFQKGKVNRNALPYVAEINTISASDKKIESGKPWD